MTISTLTRHSPYPVPDVSGESTAPTIRDRQEAVVEASSQEGELSVVGEKSITQILMDLSQLPSRRFLVQHTQEQLSHINEQANKQERGLVDSFVKDTEKAVQVLNETCDSFVEEIKQVQRNYKVITDQVLSMELGSEGYQKKIENAKAAAAFLQETSRRSREEITENKRELITALKDDSILVTQATFDKATQLMNLRKDTLAALHNTLEMLHSQQSHELECALKMHDQQLKEQSQKALQLREEVKQKMEAEDQAERIALEKRKQDWQEERDKESAAWEKQKETNARNERDQERSAAEQRDHDLRVLQEHKDSDRREAQAQRDHEYRMTDLQKPPPKKSGCVIA